MKLFTLTRGGTPLDFNVDGTVTDATAAIQGQWTARSASRTNGVTYTPTAGAPVALSTQYGFNASNQLTVAIAADANDAAVAATAIAGTIVVEDNQDLVYYAMANGDPSQFPSAFYLYGTISIDPAANQLKVDTGAGGVLVVAGTTTQGNSALSTGMADGGGDQISFSATTQNPQADGSSVDLAAQLMLTGKWDVQAGQVKFVMQYDSSGASPSLSIAIAGQLKGVEAGFQFTTADGKSTFLFTIAGQINGVNSKGDWELAIGYANNILTASGSLNDTIVTPNGSVALAGSFNITKGGGAPLQMQVSLQATWKFKGGQLLVSVARDAGGGYNLALTGNITVGDAWSVKLAASKSSTGGASFQIDVGYAPPNSDLNAQLSLFCNSQGVQFKLGLSLTLDFVDGALVPSAKAS